MLESIKEQLKMHLEEEEEAGDASSAAASAGQRGKKKRGADAKQDSEATAAKKGAGTKAKSSASASGSQKGPAQSPPGAGAKTHGAAAKAGAAAEASTAQDDLDKLEFAFPQQIDESVRRPLVGRTQRASYEKHRFLEWLDSLSLEDVLLGEDLDEGSGEEDEGQAAGVKRKLCQTPEDKNRDRF